MHIHAPLDHVAFANAWRTKRPMDKLIWGGGLILHAAVLPPVPFGIVIFLVASGAALLSARIPLRAWVRFLAPQMAFVCAAVLPLGWGEGMERAGLMWLRGMAAAASMSLLALTTPIPDLLVAARSLRVPAVLIEMSFLVYRLVASIQVLCERLGLGLDLRLRGRRPTLAVTSMMGVKLLARSLETARRLERGAAIRGLDGFPMLGPRTESGMGFRMAGLAVQGALLSAGVVYGGARWW